MPSYHQLPKEGRNIITRPTPVKRNKQNFPGFLRYST